MRYPFLRGMQIRVVDGPASYFRIMWGRIMHYLLKNSERRVKVSIGDYMLRRKNLSHFQFCVSALCLDIDKYYNNKDASFYYQTIAKLLWYGKDYDTTADNERFSNTLDSILSQGFDSDSVVDLDCDITLQDGTHRTAALLCLHQYLVDANIYPYRFRWFDDAEKYIMNLGFDQQYISDVNSRYLEIEMDLLNVGASLSLYFPNHSALIDQVLHREHIRELRRMNTVNGGLFIQFTFYNPKYRIEDGFIISCAAKNLERTLRRNKIEGFSIARNCIEGMALFSKFFKNVN